MGFYGVHRVETAEFPGIPGASDGRNRLSDRGSGQAKVRRTIVYRADVVEATIWDQVLARIETKVNRHSFYTWFRPTTLLSDGGGSLTIRVPNPLFKDWLTKH